MVYFLPQSTRVRVYFLPWPIVARIIAYHSIGGATRQRWDGSGTTGHAISFTHGSSFIGCHSYALSIFPSLNQRKQHPYTMFDTKYI
jgi:hypothetical protein